MILDQFDANRGHLRSFEATILGFIEIEFLDKYYQFDTVCI